MKKLYNNDPGSLKSHFEDFEATPSFGVWGGVQSEIAKTNRSKEKRTAIARIGAVIGASALVFFALHNSTENTIYNPRSAAPIAENVSIAPDFPEYTISQNYPNSAIHAHNSSNHIAFNPNQSQHQNNLELAANSSSENADFIANNTNTRFVGAIELDYLRVKEPKAIEQNLDNSLRVINSNSIVTNTSNLEESSWFVDVRAGTDVTDGLYAIPESNSLFQGNAPGYPGGGYGPYQIGNPVQLYLGARHQLTPLYSVYAGIQATSIKAIAITDVTNGTFSKKEGKLYHVGVTAGIRMDMTRYGRITPFVSGDLNFSRVTGAKFTEIDYANSEVINTEIFKEVGNKTYVGANGSFGLRYHMLNRLSLEAMLVVSRPLVNYTHEMNPYSSDKFATIGSRFGISIAI